MNMNEIKNPKYLISREAYTEGFEAGRRQASEDAWEAGYAKGLADGPAYITDSKCGCYDALPTSLCGSCPVDREYLGAGS
jgi:hypothetical protein